MGIEKSYDEWAKKSNTAAEAGDLEELLRLCEENVPHLFQRLEKASRDDSVSLEDFKNMIAAVITRRLCFTDEDVLDIVTKVLIPLTKEIVEAEGAGEVAVRIGESGAISVDGHVESNLPFNASVSDLAEDILEITHSTQTTTGIMAAMAESWKLHHPEGDIMTELFPAVFDELGFKTRIKPHIAGDNDFLN